MNDNEVLDFFRNAPLDLVDDAMRDPDAFDDYADERTPDDDDLDFWDDVWSLDDQEKRCVALDEEFEERTA